MNGLTPRSAAHLRKRLAREDREVELKRSIREGVARQPHVVYRCYDADDRLLYVGCTHDIGARMQVHASSWDNPASALLTLRMARHTEVEYPDRASARAAEVEAIRTEHPLANLHHQDPPLTPAKRRAVLNDYLAATHDAGLSDFFADVVDSFVRNAPDPAP